MSARRIVGAVLGLGLTAAFIVPGISTAATTPAPGAPGQAAWYLPADKTGFGTAYGSATSKVWFTVEHGRLSEIYYPNLSTPATRELDFIVVDGTGHAARVSATATSHTTLTDHHALEYQSVNTDPNGHWRLTQTYVTDPNRSTVAVDLNFRSLDANSYKLYAFYDPSLTNQGNDDHAAATATSGTAWDGSTATALVANPALSNVSVGYVGTSDGWTDLSTHGAQTWTYASAATPGNVAITGLTSLNGTTDTHATVYLGFDSSAPTNGAAALVTANASATVGFTALETAYTKTWHDYLATLNAPPSSLQTNAEQNLYASSEMELAAAEDKTYPGAYVASPSMPWTGGMPDTNSQTYGYHMVWPRDLYNIATALIADGDVAGAKRALAYMWKSMQAYSNLFMQFQWVDSSQTGGGVQLDETAFPLILADQLHATDVVTWTRVRDTTNALINYRDPMTGLRAPSSPQERWEERYGYSPSTIAAEIAGLASAAHLAFETHHELWGLRVLRIAKQWSNNLATWTVTSNGPLSSSPYYIRLSVDGNANSGAQYSLGNTAPNVDQRSVTDQGFLELVRLGIRKANDPVILNSLKVTDANIGYPAGQALYWHRYTSDGYGETATGAAWNTSFGTGQTSFGRFWPLLTGERGEYAVLAGQDASIYLTAMTNSANEAGLLPEQVWDTQAPGGQANFAIGTPTTSATPLSWTHAQYIRLAVDMAAGKVLERPTAVCFIFHTCK